MKTYKGKVRMIGAGTYVASNNGTGGTQISALEIGDETLTRIYLSDYLSNYLKVGEDAELLVYKTLSKHAIVGLRIGGKTYTTPIGSFLILFLLQIIAFVGIVAGIGVTAGNVSDNSLISSSAIVTCVIYVGLKVKTLIQLMGYR
jgi:hypothetical protein